MQLCGFQDFINELTLYLNLVFGSHSHSDKTFWRKSPRGAIDAIGTACAIKWKCVEMSTATYNLAGSVQYQYDGCEQDKTIKQEGRCMHA